MLSYPRQLEVFTLEQQATQSDARSLSPLTISTWHFLVSAIFLAFFRLDLIKLNFQYQTDSIEPGVGFF